MAEERRKFDETFDLKLDAIGVKIDTLANSNIERFNNLSGSHKELKKEVKKINLILDGNGNPEKGHSTQIVLIKKDIKTLFKKFKQFDKFHYAIIIMVIVAIIKIAFFA